MNFRKAFVGLAAVSALTLGGVAQAQNISIGTGGTGGVYYPLGGGLLQLCPSTFLVCRPLLR